MVQTQRSEDATDRRSDAACAKRNARNAQQRTNARYARKGGVARACFLGMPTVREVARRRAIALMCAVCKARAVLRQVKALLRGNFAQSFYGA